MKTVYACTHISKEIELDDFEHGCQGERTCTMNERCNLVGATFAELLDKLRTTYGIALDDLFIPDEDEPIRYFGWNRLENAEGDTPGNREESEWKEGKLKLWLADWSFSVEKRTIEPIALDEIKAIITTH